MPKFLEFNVVLVLAFALAADGKTVGFIKKPRFSFVDKNVVMVKYKSDISADMNRSLHVCCTIWDKTTLPRFKEFMCGHFVNKCPNFIQVPRSNCRSSGTDEICQIGWVFPEVVFQGYVSSKDLQNNTLTSPVATFMTNETTKAPRPVSNLSISHQGSDLLMQWTPSGIFVPSSEYSQLVYCQATKNGQAKAFRRSLNYLKSSLLVHTTNFSAVTNYRCCVQVENVVTSVLSERTCQNVTTLEQVPSQPPIILCGNDTVCPTQIKGNQRNITVLFKLPDVSLRSGKIIGHFVIYKNVRSTNFSELEITNSSAREARLVGLDTRSSYLIYMKSCTEVGCSALSKPVLIPPVPLTNGVPSKTMLVAIIATGGAVLFIVLGIILFVRRHKRLERLKMLPKLELNTAFEYNYPVGIAEEVEYNKLSVGTLLGCEDLVSSKENIGVAVSAVVDES